MARREMKSNPNRSIMSQLIAKHVAEFDEVYENRTAGDMTFTGMLYEFVWDLEDHGLIQKEK